MKPRPASGALQIEEVRRAPTLRIWVARSSHYCGSVIVGARKFIAFNINLETTDIRVAKDSARHPFQ